MKPVQHLVTVTVVAALVAAPAFAQQPDPHQHGQQPGAQAAPGRPGAPGMGPGMMGGMGGMMGRGMGMMHGRGGDGPLALCPTAAMMAHDDARANARTLKLCGDLLKAMGEVLLKHGAELEKSGH
jgi:hypothetical protein